MVVEIDQVLVLNVLLLLASNGHVYLLIEGISLSIPRKRERQEIGAADLSSTHHHETHEPLYLHPHLRQREYASIGQVLRG